MSYGLSKEVSLPLSNKPFAESQRLSVNKRLLILTPRSWWEEQLRGRQTEPAEWMCFQPVVQINWHHWPGFSLSRSLSKERMLVSAFDIKVVIKPARRDTWNIAETISMISWSLLSVAARRHIETSKSRILSLQKGNCQTLLLRMCRILQENRDATAWSLRVSLSPKKHVECFTRQSSAWTLHQLVTF